jgi:tetratricopeptide (TPR) repeat protein
MGKSKAQFSILMIFFILFGLARNLYAADRFLDRGMEEYKAGNYEEAFELLTQARERQPESSLAAYYLGLTCKQMMNDREAIQSLMDAIRLTPSIPEAYPELIEIYYQRDQLKEAKEWIIKAEAAGVKPGQISFLKGLIFFKEGQYQNAIDAFKKAKKADPSLTQSADLHMAMVYSRERRFAKARESLNAVISIDPASEPASFAKEYEDVLARVAQRYKAWWGEAAAAYQYNDNLVLKPSSEIPDVVITRERDSGMITDLTVGYSPRLKEPWILYAQYDSYTNTYFDNHKVNLIQQTASFIPGYNFPKGAITLPCTYSYLWLHSDKYMSVVSARLTLSFMPIENHIGQLLAGYIRREMLQLPSSRNENRDANLWIISPRYLYAFSGGKGLFDIRYELWIDEAEGKNWENIGNRLKLSLLVPVVDRVCLTISGDAFLQDYRHTHTIFGMKRSDRTYMGLANIRWEILRGLSFTLQYAYTKADSNISVYEYEQNLLTAGMAYNF